MAIFNKETSKNVKTFTFTMAGLKEALDGAVKSTDVDNPSTYKHGSVMKLLNDYIAIILASSNGENLSTVANDKLNTSEPVLFKLAFKVVVNSIKQTKRWPPASIKIVNRFGDVTINYE